MASARCVGVADAQLMFSAFKTLTGQTVTIELKNDLAIQGTLKSVDQFLNFKLDDIRVLDQARFPHMVSGDAHASSRADGGQVDVHPRVSRALRAHTACCYRHAAARGRDSPG